MMITMMITMMMDIMMTIRSELKKFGNFNNNNSKRNNFSIIFCFRKTSADVFLLFEK